MRPDTDIRFRAGSLRHPITINQRVPTNPPGFSAAGPTFEWVPFTKAMAQISPQRSSVIIRNGQAVSETIIPITIRYQKGITAKMQVVAQNGTYLIDGIINADERNWLMELQCVAFADDL